MAGLGAPALAGAPWLLQAVRTAEPTRQLQPGGPSGLLATGASGGLWALSRHAQAPRRLADGLDPETPLATGQGRLAARLADGGLLVWQDGRSHTWAAASWPC